MSPRDVEKIVAAALQWNAARANRLAAGAEKRRADQAIRSAAMSPLYGSLRAKGLAIQRMAAKALSHTKRQELAAARALAKLCPSGRVDLPMADVVVQLPLVRRPEAADTTFRDSTIPA